MVIPKKILVCIGDSWTWGSEIVNPEYEKYRGTDFLHTQLGDCQYRLSNTYPGVISKELGFDEFHNLGACGESNDYIFNKTLKWYYNNRNNNELFFIVGLTSPERVGFDYECDGKIKRMMINPNWDVSNLSNEPCFDMLKVFWMNYIIHFSHKKEYLDRYVRQVSYLENFFKNNNIKYLFFNAFYDFSQLLNKQTEPEIKSIWDSIDEKRFYGKNNFETFRSFILKKGNNTMTNDHASEIGHKIWSNELIDFILKNY